MPVNCARNFVTKGIAGSSDGVKNYHTKLPIKTIPSGHCTNSQSRIKINLHMQSENLLEN